MRRFGLFFSMAVIALVTAAVPCFAGQIAVLKNGFQIRHERREVVGDVTRLYVSADGSSFVDVPTAELDHFEGAPDVPVANPLLSGSGLPGSRPVSSRNLENPVPSASAARSSSSPPQPDITAVVKDASGRYQLDPDLVNSVIKAESGFHVRAVSPKGAQGLMQLMPGTASQLGVPNAFDPSANVDGGTKYLRELLERYNFDLVKALAAYNAGPQRVERFGGVPPYYETRAYVARIVRDFNKKKLAQQKVTAKRTPSNTPSAKKPASPKKVDSGKAIPASTGSP